MDIAHLALAVAIVVAFLIGLGWRQRAQRAEADVAAAISAAGDDAGRPPVSATDAVRSLDARHQAADARLRLVEATVARSAAGIMVLDEDLDIIFATDAVRRLFQGRHGDAAAAIQIRTLARDVIQTQRQADQRIELFDGRRVLRVRIDPQPAEVGGGAAAHVSDVSEEERVDAIRQDFVANVSHELKTPVGALAVLAEALEHANDDATRQRLSARLGAEAQRVVTLVDDVLELSLLERDPTAMAQVDLGDVVAEAMRRVEVIATSSGVSVLSEVPRDPVLAEGDARQLISAVANLLDNGIKYGSLLGEQGTEVRARVARDGDRCTIEVVDHGIGIPDSHRDRIFERFYRVDAARSRSRGGTGLGLAIVRHVAINHGGGVEVESRLGAGSTFRLWIPARQG